MDTYLINLERRPDRLSEVSRKMAELGLPFKIF
ncbi:MAG TPA: glycosyl transferase, partial [Thalassospira sp.]|nr:glycosyl transferase [Thalassospira sp.]